MKRYIRSSESTWDQHLDFGTKYAKQLENVLKRVFRLDNDVDDITVSEKNHISYDYIEEERVPIVLNGTVTLLVNGAIGSIGVYVYGVVDSYSSSLNVCGVELVFTPGEIFTYGFTSTRSGGRELLSADTIGTLDILYTILSDEDVVDELNRCKYKLQSESETFTRKSTLPVVQTNSEIRNIARDVLLNIINYIEARTNFTTSFRIKKLRKDKVINNKLFYNYIIVDDNGQEYHDKLYLIQEPTTREWYDPQETYDIDDLYEAMFQNYAEISGISF